ncbi:Uma2 family endonuclease [Spirulina sp. CCNP1310]|uniref:Uma2 family endonuclease n=1 Tax=Spirulina sp. CCNP1310 TaxID=3110249 RepID=UPI002B1F0905|nr:Uma2 family endonuclease [Spirulina sp. CCNP1310]MEA5418079.1 Uma2 family endonuclease [Spirulina sp. CCNP1310]
MVQQPPTLNPTVVYPDSDGQPMAENTEQFQWIVMIKENLEILFADDPDVFIAGDLLWYPVEGDNKLRAAPDAMVAFGRPKGRRGSYRQWEEGQIAPQVVFEILSPGNRTGEMVQKFKFYERYGVEEYYIYDPDHFELTGWLREGNELEAIAVMTDWVSPRLQIRFGWDETGLTLYYPDGQRFLTSVELHRRAVDAEAALAQERECREQERARAEQAEAALAALQAKLAALGIDPQDVE